MARPTEILAIVPTEVRDTGFDGPGFMHQVLGIYADVDLWGVLREVPGSWSLRLNAGGTVRVERTSDFLEAVPDGGLTKLFSPNYQTLDPGLYARQGTNRPLGRCVLLAAQASVPFLEAACRDLSIDFESQSVSRVLSTSSL